MINEKSIEAVGGSKFSERFVKPLYDSYCFSNIPGTIEQLLVGETTLGVLPKDTLILPEKQYDKVVLFFIDAFGWRFFEQFKDEFLALQRFVSNGRVSKLTSQFPSTTAAHVTAIHTGLPVGNSGVYEWFFYEPKLDTMIAPLLFAFAGDPERDTLKTTGIDPRELYPTDNVYKHLAGKVPTHLFQSEHFTPSPYNDAVSTGVDHLHPFPDHVTALSELEAVLKGSDEKLYAYFYHGEIDSAGHEYGPDSPEFTEAARIFFTDLEAFVERTKGQCGNTLLLMTADHGQTHMNPATTVLLDEVLPEIKDWTKTNQKGEFIAPAGSARDFFLHIKDEHVQEAVAAIRMLVEGKAEVYLVEDLIEQGFFGPIISDTFRGRVGNVVVLPYEGESVYWWGGGKFDKPFYGHHGGLTKDEMETIFLALEL